MSRTGLAPFAGLCILFIGAAEPAYAYIDPGTGSMLMQMIVAGLAAGAGTVAVYWSRLRALFSRRRDASSKEE